MPWFSSSLSAQDARYDVHCHLLPDVDDGLRDLNAFASAMEQYRAMGYRGAVITPHSNERFQNSEAFLREQFETLKTDAADVIGDFQLAIGAEYVLDETLMQRVYDHDDLLTFGVGATFLLAECSMVHQPPMMEEFLDECARQNIRPIIAHVERYQYIRMDTTASLMIDWRDRGALLQMNVGSIAGMYGDGYQHVAKTIWWQGLIDMLGTDLHDPHYMRKAIPRGWKTLGKKDVGFSTKWQHLLFEPASNSA